VAKYTGIEDMGYPCPLYSPWPIQLDLHLLSLFTYLHPNLCQHGAACFPTLAEVKKTPPPQKKEELKKKNGKKYEIRVKYKRKFYQHSSRPSKREFAEK